MFKKIKNQVPSSSGRRAKKAEKVKHREEVARRAIEQAKQELAAREQLGLEDGMSSPLQIQSNQAQPWQDPTEAVPQRDAASRGSPTQEMMVYPYQSTRSTNVSLSPIERQSIIKADDADVSTNDAEKSQSRHMTIMNRPRPVEPDPAFVGDVRAKTATWTRPPRPDEIDQEEELSNLGLVRSKAISRRPLPPTAANGGIISVSMHGNSSPAQSRLSNSQHFASDSFRSRSDVFSIIEDYVNPQMGAGHDGPGEEHKKERDQRPQFYNGASPRTIREPTKFVQPGEQPGDEDDKISSSLEDAAAKEMKTLKEQADRYRNRIEELVVENAKLEGRWEERLEATKRTYEESLGQERSQHVSEEKEMQDDFLITIGKRKKEYEGLKARAAADAKLKDETLKKMEADKMKELRDEQEKHGQALGEQKETAKKELATAKAALQNVITDKEAEIDKLKRERQTVEVERKELRNQLAIAKVALDDIRAEKDKENEGINNAHQQQIQHWEAKVGQVRAQKDKEIQEINDSHQQQIQQWEAKVSRLHAQKDKEIAEKKFAHQQEVEGFEARVHQLILEKNKEITDISDRYETFVAQLKNDFLEDKANAIRQLTMDNERLLRISIKKEVFKAMTDTDLEERFGAIRREVDGLARVDWNEPRKLDWPVPEHAIQQAKIPRIAKQHLIQNTLWAILYEKIFRTPFRVLGSEGMALDQDWAQEFGQGGNAAPEATKKAEKWRYDNMVKCVEAVKSPTHDTKYIKDGYNSTVRDVTEILFAELHQVATIDDMKRHDIDKNRVNEMMKMAAQFWLDVGLQRFRTKVIVSETGQPAVLSRQSNAGPNGNLNIVVLPELRRLGNAQGGQLEQEEIVMVGDFKVSRVR